MGTFEGAYGPWLGVYDAVYASLRAQRTLSRGRVPPELDLTLKLLITQGFTGYTVKPSPTIDVDLLAGTRLWAVRSTLALTSGIGQRSNERSPTWADFLLGGRVRWRIDRKWQVNVSGDGGAGASRGTGEGMGTVDYALSHHWSVFVAYRHLYENYHKNDYFFTGHLTGPVIGGAYHW
jgi:hypothetical protein